MEIINSEHAKEVETLQEKHRDELQEYKDRVSVYKNDLEVLESARDTLELMLEDLKRENGEEKQVSANVPVDTNQSIFCEKITLLEVENDELADAVEHLKAELTEALKMNVQCEVRRPTFWFKFVFAINFLSSISFSRTKLKISWIDCGAQRKIFKQNGMNLKRKMKCAKRLKNK